VYHAVSRVDGGRQRIVYRRSDNGGRTWPSAASFEGPGGGATDPVIAVDGQVVAIAFVGGWCPGDPAPCTEAPFLVLSTDGGRFWGTPRRLDQQAFTVSVAVDGAQVWMAWDRAGGVEVRGYSTAYQTLAKESYPGATYDPQVAADGGAAVVAWSQFDGPRAVMARAAVIGPVRQVGPSGATLAFAQSVAVQPDGRVHVLVQDGEVLRVRSSGAGDTFGDPVEVMPAGESSAISAGRGLVAVAAGLSDGTTVVSASIAGATFSEPEVVATASPDEGRPLVGVTVPRRRPDRPIARFDWSVPERYVEGVGGRRIPANATPGPIGLDDITVRLDGCQSMPGTGSIVSRQWTVDGDELSAAGCEIELTVSDGEEREVKLEVTDSAGESASMTTTVAPKNHVVVSMGDSIASGEGNPHTPWSYTSSVYVPVTWRDRACHRSDLAGPARGAAALEDSDTRSSVTFVHLACSGASMLDTTAVAGAPPGPVDDPDTGGLLDAYHGIEPRGDPPRPSQLQQMTDLLGGRAPDAVLLSIGANDIRFSDVVMNCIVSEPGDPRPCHRAATAARAVTRLGTLPTRYQQLADALVAAGVAPDSTFITEYFDPTTDDLGLENLRCIGNSESVGEFAEYVAELAALVEQAGANPAVQSVAQAVGFLSGLLAAGTDGGVVTDDETAWARGTVVRGLNDAVSAAASTHGWNFVGGIADGFVRHGYCADDSWTVTIGDSLAGQADLKGAVHPNGAGHVWYGRQIGAALLRADGVTIDPTEPPTEVQLGDIYVTTATNETVVGSIVRDTGAVPEFVGARLMDRVSGDGYLGPGVPAADAATAVTPWWQVDQTSGVVPSALVGQITVAENASLRSVRIAQAPADGTKLVAGRDTVVMAGIDARLGAPQTVDVTTEVFAGDPGQPPDTIVGPVTEQVLLVPGENDVVLPVGQAFTVPEGKVVSANVSITDPVGPGGDPNDNDRSSDPAFEPQAVTTRPMSMVMLPIAVPGDALSCATVGRVAARTGSFAAAALPVAGSGSAPGLTIDLACSTVAAPSNDEVGALDALVSLDHLARVTARDVIVGVVPSGWLQTHAKGAVGIAAGGMRAVLIESTAPNEVLAHEVAHALGLEHVDGRTARGVRLPARTALAGVDWMNSFVAPKVWTGGETWDSLFTRIGGPLSARSLPDVLRPGVWIRGSVVRLPDGKLGMRRAQWSPAASQPAPDPDLEELELERLTAVQLDAAGDEVERTTVRIEAVEGLYTPGAGEPDEPTVGAFATEVDLDPATTTIQLLDPDGVVVDERVVGAAPTVEVTAPSGGSTVSRDDPLVVSWTADDVDSADLTADVLVSADGVAWSVLAAGLDAAAGTATVATPRSLDGTAVRVRVVVSDGVRSAQDDSDPFTVDGGASGPALTESVVFNPDENQVWLARPDFSAQQRVPLPTAHDTGLDTASGVRYLDLSLSPEGRIYMSTNLATRALVSEDELNRSTRPDQSYRIMSMRPDGSDLRVLSRPAQQAGNYLWTFSYCPEVAPDGTRMLWTNSLLTPSGDRVGEHAVVVAGVDGSTPTRLVSSGVSVPQSALGAAWPVSVTGAVVVTFNAERCPRWSSDGEEIVLPGFVSYDYLPPSSTTPVRLQGNVVVVVDAATGAVTRALGEPSTTVDWSTTDWFPNGDIYATRARVEGTCTPFSCDIVQEHFIVDALTGALTNLPAQPTRGFRGFDSFEKVSPDGRVVYGRALTPGMVRMDVATGVRSVGPVSASEFDWGLADLGGSGEEIAVEVVPPADPSVGADAGGPYEVVQDQLLQLDASASSALADPTALAEWDVDGDGVFGDVVGPRPSVSFETPGTVEVRVQITPGFATQGTPVVSEPATVVVLEAPSPPEPIPAEGADDTPVPAVAAPTSRAYDVPADSTVWLQLEPAGQRLRIGQRSVGSVTFTVPGDSGGPEPLVTGPDGRVQVTTGGAEEVTIVVESLGGGQPVEITIRVVEPEPPVAGDDERTVVVGERTTFPAAELLTNDSGDGPLQVVGLSGADNGAAWLDGDGRVVVQAEQVGAGTARVLVADATGATATSQLRLTVVPAQAATTTTTPTTTTTTTTVPAVTLPPPTPTIPAATSPAATSPAATIPAFPVAGAPAVPPVGTPSDVRLPETGTSIARVLTLAAFALGLGVVLVSVRRRGTTTHRQP
jgi:hypothetical protein